MAVSSNSLFWCTVCQSIKVIHWFGWIDAPLLLFGAWHLKLFSAKSTIFSYSIGKQFPKIYAICLMELMYSCIMSGDNFAMLSLHIKCITSSLCELVVFSPFSSLNATKHQYLWQYALQVFSSQALKTV